MADMASFFQNPFYHCGSDSFGCGAVVGWACCGENSASINVLPIGVLRQLLIICRKLAIQ